MEKFLKGKGWYIPDRRDLSKIEEDKIERAVVSKDEIDIDYNYYNKKLHLKLKRENDIRFEGYYEDHKHKIGDCGFTFYENKKEYFLFGGYSSAEDGSGTWCIKLLKPEEKQEKNEPT